MAGSERWPSGLRRTLGKRVCGQPYRGFESHSLRQFLLILLRKFNLSDFGPTWAPTQLTGVSGRWWNVVGDVPHSAPAPTAHRVKIASQLVLAEAERTHEFFQFRRAGSEVAICSLRWSSRFQSSDCRQFQLTHFPPAPRRWRDAAAAPAPGRRRRSPARRRSPLPTARARQGRRRALPGFRS